MSDSKTLCEWNEKKIKNEFIMLVEIVSAPKVVCKKCARAASKKKYLCEPRKIGGE
jgi:hypothetical protein